MDDIQIIDEQDQQYNMTDQQIRAMFKEVPIEVEEMQASDFDADGNHIGTITYFRKDYQDNE